MIDRIEDFSRSMLEAYVVDARQRTLGLVGDLSDEHLRVPLLRIINPFVWEIGHVAYFQEYWVLRHVAGEAPGIGNSDSLYDSAKIAHDTRWHLPLPSRADTIDYLESVRDRVLDRIASPSLDGRDAYFILLSVFHEDMHDEALTITRQTLSYPEPNFVSARISIAPIAGDAYIPAGTYLIGSKPDDGFIFDNEKWSHPVDVDAFRIARIPVTQAEFLAFVEDDGYQRQELWTSEGWSWRNEVDARHPVYWREDLDEGWKRRQFDRWVPLEHSHPVANVCWFEAEAFCRWAGRRLPSAEEWETAARVCERRYYPWGHTVWEWTSSDFLPYPGFSEDPYREYSSPWFGTHKELRGGAWSTQPRLIRPAYRNFYTPDRRDIWAGFRTCALEP